MHHKLRKNKTVRGEGISREGNEMEGYETLDFTDLFRIGCRRTGKWF